MAAQGIDQPLPTIAANGTHIGLAQPVLLNGRKGNKAQGVSEAPVPTLDTKGGVWLAEPFVLSQHNSGSPRAAADPLPTVTTGGAASEKRQGCARPMLVEPFILNRHGDNGGVRAHSTETPAPTVTNRGNGYLIEPVEKALVTSYYGASKTPQSTADPLPTVTTKDRFGIVVPITHAGGLDRSLDVNASPVPTITTANRGELALVEGDTEFDILFRMLEPHELAAAMGFIRDDATYEFAGTKTEQIKQIGNAVSVRKMKACVGALMADEAEQEAA